MVKVGLTNGSVQSHLSGVMGHALGTTFASVRQAINFGSLDFDQDYLMSAPYPDQGRLRMLLESSTQLLSVMDGCDASFCLDMYRLPEESEDSPEEWAYTDTGHNVFQAKYRRSSKASSLLGKELLGAIKRHPLLMQSTAVAAMPPSSDHGARPDCPRDWSRDIARELGLVEVRVTRSRSAPSQKNFEEREARRSNQTNSMAVVVDLSGMEVLVVDDLYMLGDSMSEITRALRAAGARTVFGLCAAKTAKGCQGYSY